MNKSRLTLERTDVGSKHPESTRRLFFVTKHGWEPGLIGMQAMDAKFDEWALVIGLK